MFFNPWKPFTASQPKGVMVRGDSSVPETKWWNHLWLLLFGWSNVVVLRVETVPSGGWYIGYRDFRGGQHVRMKQIFESEVRMKVGREDCTFFAVTGAKQEIEVPLENVSVQHKNVPSAAPLL